MNFIEWATGFIGGVSIGMNLLWFMGILGERRESKKPLTILRCPKNTLTITPDE